MLVRSWQKVTAVISGGTKVALELGIGMDELAGW